MTMMKGLLAAAVSLACLTAASSAQAAVTFRLADVTFTDGGVAKGTFTANDALTEITDWAITTTASTNGLGLIEKATSPARWDTRPSSTTTSGSCFRVNLRTMDRATSTS